MHWILRESRGELSGGLQISTTGLQLVSLLQHLHLEPLEECRRISRLTFLYKILNEHVAVPNAYESSRSGSVQERIARNLIWVGINVN